MSDLDTIKNAPTKAAKVMTSFCKAVSATNGKSLLSEQEKRAHIEMLQTDARRKIREIDDDMAKAYTRLTAKRPSRPVGNATEEFLSETQKIRSWDRVKQLLDASLKPGGPDTMQVIMDQAKTAAGKKDHATAAALDEDLRPWLASHQLDYLIDILDTLTKPVQALLTENVSAEANEVDVAEIKVGYHRVQTALEMSRHAITEIDPSTTPGAIPITLGYDLPAYEKGETVAIEPVKMKTEEKDANGQVMQTQVLPELVEEG